MEMHVRVWMNLAHAPSVLNLCIYMFLGYGVGLFARTSHRPQQQRRPILGSVAVVGVSGRLQELGSHLVQLVVLLLVVGLVSGTRVHRGRGAGRPREDALGRGAADPAESLLSVACATLNSGRRDTPHEMEQIFTPTCLIVYGTKRECPLYAGISEGTGNCILMYQESGEAPADSKLL